MGFSALVAADAPTNVQASDGTSPDFVLVTFNATANTDQYYIFASTLQDPDHWFFVGNTPTTWQWIFNAMPGTVYNYRVFPIGQNVQNPEYSAVDRGHRSGLPNSVLSLTATPMSNNRISVDWIPPAGGWTNFALFRSDDAGDPGCQHFYRRVLHPWFVDTAVQAGVTYYYSVMAVSPQGRSTLCSPIDGAMPGL